MAPSKMVLDRKKSADSVVAATRTHEERIAKAIEEALGAGCDEATRTLLQACWKAVDAVSGALVIADEDHNLEVADDAGPREVRDRAAKALQGKLVADRDTFTGVFGPAYVAELGFSGTTPVQPDAVLELAKVVVKRLGERQAPTPRLPDYRFDAEQWANGYAPFVEALEGALETLRRELRENEATQVDKARAMGRFDSVFSQAASLISALLEAGGEKELARKLRPSTRRPGLTAELAEDPPALDDAPAADAVLEDPVSS